MCMPQGCVHALGSLFAKESQLFFFWNEPLLCAGTLETGDVKAQFEIFFSQRAQKKKKRDNWSEI